MTPNEQSMYVNDPLPHNPDWGRASLRHKSKESPNPILNHGMEVPLHEYWTLADFHEWTGHSYAAIVQAAIFGLCRQKDYRIIRKILRDGGLEVSNGKKEPLP